MTREEAIRYFDFIIRTEDYNSKQASAARIALSALTPPNEWVSVEERLPDKPCRVLVRVTGLDILDIDTDRLVNGKWIRWPGSVTHWMPLPAPPDRRPPEGERRKCLK